MGCAMVGLSAGGGGMLAVIVPLVVLGVVIGGGVWLARHWADTHMASSSPEPSGSGAGYSTRAEQLHSDAADDIDDEVFERRPAGVNFH
jgi:hypothetical protein